ncbi:cytosolic Fe-S cluster assembly factor NAR1 [Pochonia chlamydosporia 170]|uniref:Cytosolic Fe-S cluster assembly factor NAR1 n=1 Tax=Pochonia chlamydosporia 170 TaxID=1380566 RepID=A0A179G4W5_METCM|nr:cytosolic Fe-S cluster assembly factor NAR1 [Pochonia chlamydosporia 170]OAQ72383.1 cytosolic Fe-S cluster assembly factor NAR1 [Pochonia chlamydosporia 170]
MSAILSVDDLNDFISPGVACIKPIETLPAAAPQSSETEVILDGQQSSSTGGAEPAQISLTDCLACSGCVTSAEAVLVSLQSHAEVLSTLDAAPALRIVPDGAGGVRVDGLENEEAKLFVASVSPQTRANLAAACGKGLSEAQAGRMLERLLRKELAGGGAWGNGFTWVVDTNVAREAALVLGADEVLRGDGGVDAPSQPVLSSACPGWVCYAEKTHPHVLRHLSRVKSPQALMGTILKTTLSRKLGIAPSRIWHLAVMPCFDKKLEASREELTDEVWAGSGLPGRGVRDVDCVITSKEILMLAESRGLDFFNISGEGGDDAADHLRQSAVPFPDQRLHNFLFPPRAGPRVPRTAGSSGGLLYYILQCKAAQIPGAEIQTTRGRNADVVEFVVAVNGEPVFKAARYYGFRNIQNLVRRLKPARPSRMPGGKPFGSARRPTGKSASLEYGYVEVMACPGGCTNGGGQIKVDDPVVLERKQISGKPGPQEQKEWLAEVDEAYFSGEEVDGPAGANGRGDNGAVRSSEDVVGGISRSYIHDTLAYWCEVTGISIDRLAFTTYREVISDVGKGTEAERVVQLAGKVGGGW